QPGVAAMQSAGTAHWCNATHLVISDEQHPRCGSFLRASDVGLPFDGEARSDSDPYVVVNASSDEFALNTEPHEAALFVTREVMVAGKPVTVKSSLQHLKEQAFKYDLAYYSQQCGISEAQIIALAQRFTSYGTKAVVDTHGGN
ncbi:tetrathionate reductase subunit TtrA, partial [Vibrio fluvialis]|nr:tetrathionate reductase subunit TtrA [Vibrio fluvialis]